MSWCCKTKINALLMYDVQDKETMKSEILHPFRLWKNMAMPQKGNLVDSLSKHSLQA